MGRELLTWVTNTRRGSWLTCPCATDVSLCSGPPLVRRRSLNLISWGKKKGGGGVDLSLLERLLTFIYLKTPDVGTRVNKGGRLVSGEVRKMEGSEGSAGSLYRSPRGCTFRRL